MNTPPLLIAMALLFWGWRTGWWVIAGTLAILFEASRILKFRWEFTEKEYSRVFDVCTLLFGGSVIYLRFSEEISRSGFLLFQWMPVLFALMMLTQAYGSRDKIPFRVFSWFMRLRKNKSSDLEGSLNISWSYFAICLLAAGATNQTERDQYFFIGASLLCLWAAWATRIRRYTAPIWAACCLLAIGGGYIGHLGWSGLQAALLPYIGEVFARFGPKDFDALHARTTMGELGSKKNSGKILLRVKAESGRVPQLLRQATFDLPKGTTWNATHREFNAVAPENDVTTFTLLPDQPTNDVVRISGYINRRKALLSLPQGSTRVRELPVTYLKTTSLGVARAEENPAVVSYLAEFAQGKSFESEPSTNEFEVPAAEKPAIAEIAQKLKAAAGTNQMELLRAVERYFAQNFSYTLYNKENVVKKESPLVNFLTKTRSGHCEYFASATVLLLRELGIPARYAVGFSVQEAKGDSWIVRERHAHAWALAWINGAWQEVDTTPGTWASAEREQASWFEPISDFFSELSFKFAKWRWLGQKGVISRVAPFLILPLVAILIWRIFFRKKRVEAKKEAREIFNWPGLDSEYYELEARLAASGHERQPHETPEQWLRRLKKDGIEHPSLPALVELHYRYRFDPRGLKSDDRTRLRQLAEARIDAQQGSD